MHILFVTMSCSQRLANRLFEETHRDPSFQIIKFTRLLLEGFNHNNADVETLCGLSSEVNRFYWKEPDEVIKNIRYRYISFFEMPVLRQLCILIGAFFKTMSWIIRTRKNPNDRIIIHDVLANSACLGSRFAAKLCHIPTCALVTDMPGLSVNEKIAKKQPLYNLILRTRARQINKRINSYSSYILLTEQMNSVINTHHRPYVVMEGLVDIDDIPETNIETKKHSSVILYAGALYEQYGLKAFIDAVMLSSHKNIELHLYGQDKGSGFKDYILSCAKRDKRIIYKGLAKNEDIVKAEQAAALLINPRFSNLEIAQYSFPSKNMEYMLSGTPLLTTRLPGMPKEYYDYVYTFDEESTNGFAKKIDEIFSLSAEELQLKGEKAKEFVLREKNNVKQAQRILTMFKTFIHDN